MVNKKVKCISSLTPLETVFYLRTWFCAMIGINDIHLLDIARSGCKDATSDKYEDTYSLLLYRMLATPLPLQSISIYTKFFRNVRVPELDKDDMMHLDSLRRMTVAQLRLITIHKLDMMYEEIQDLPEDNKHRRSYYLFYNKMIPIISLPLLYDELTLFTFFYRFLQKQNCQDYSILLNSIKMINNQ